MPEKKKIDELNIDFSLHDDAMNLLTVPRDEAGKDRLEVFDRMPLMPLMNCPFFFSLLILIHVVIYLEGSGVFRAAKAHDDNTDDFCRRRKLRFHCLLVR